MVTAIVLVLLSGLIHSVWNLFTKQSRNKAVFLWFCQLAAIILYAPFIAPNLPAPAAVTSTGWLYLLLSVIVHGCYMILLAKTYTAGDLSQAYPIMRGTSPLLVPFVGVFILGEHLRFYGWIGIAAIVIGIFYAGYMQGKKANSSLNMTTILAAGVGVLITSYTVIDKVALQHFTPVFLNEATNIGNLLALTWIAIRSGSMKAEWSLNWKTIMLGGIMAPGGYLLFLWALRLMPVSQLAPMREIGTVFGTLLGIFVLHEAQGKQRIAASVAITFGIAMLAQSP